MKRSEMVEIMQKALSPVLDDKEDFFVKSIAFHLLKIQEQHGMLPPPTGIEYGIIRTLCYVGYDYLEIEDDVKQSLWEPEDEEE